MSQDTKETSTKAVLEQQSVAIQMRKDGFTTAEIASSLGYAQEQIESILGEPVTLGSPEEILQECLRTVVSLIPLAEASYRTTPVGFNASSLTGFIDSAKSLINEIYNLKTKEDTYKLIVQRVLEVFCREMVKALLNEVAQLKEKQLTDPKKLEEELSRFSLNLGKRFQECYRKSREDLGEVVGVGPDVRARINLSFGSSGS